MTITPSTAPIARLAILHGYGDHAGRYAHFMSWMADNNIACHALDFRGHGRSAGKIGFIHQWNEYLQDLTQFLATDQLSRTDIPLFILGHSHGGLITTAAAQQGLLDHCAGIILASPYFDLKMPVPLIKRFFAAIASTLYPSLQFTSGLNPAMVTRDPAMQADTKNDPFCRGIATPRWFFETRKAQQKVRADAKHFHHPLLMLLPGDDQVADTTAAEQFFNQCQSIDKTLLHHPEHRHELLRELNREAIFQTILNWIKKSRARSVLTE